MELTSDEYRLEDIARDHAIDAAVFVPFAIVRLCGETAATEATLQVQLRDVGDTGESRRAVRLVWSADGVPKHPLAVQDRTVTEWAACGVACAIMSLYAKLRLRSVAADGDRFDYWVGDGQHEYALEVSGTITDDVEARHRIKVRQLLENPFGVDGFVVVVGFATRSAILSFHRFEEEQ